MRFRKIFSLCLAALLLVGLAAGGAKEALALKLTLKRIIFTEKERSESLVLINDTDKTQTFRIKWINKRMLPNGEVASVEDGEDVSDLNPLDEIVRFAPRRITIAPQEYQTIRLMARVSRNTTPGEYRSHLNIAPEPEPVKVDAADGKTPQEMSFSVKMLAGVSVPVFVRIGETSATAQITDASAARTAEGFTLKFSIIRNGNQSTYGDLDMVCIKPDGEEVVVKQIRGIAIYTEITRRDFDYSLVMPEGQAGTCGTVNVRYVERNDNKTVENLLAETAVPLS